MLIEYYGQSGLTVYAILRASTGYVYNPATFELEEQTLPVEHLTYGIALTEDSNITGRYTADVTVGSAATYICEYWQMLSVSYDRTIDTRLGSTSFYWDSEKEWPAESLSTIQGGTTTINNNGTGAADGFTDEDRRKLRELYNLRLRTKV